MPEITYRPATEADLEPIVAIARRIWTMGMSKRLEDRFGVQGGKSWDEWTADDIGGAVRARLATCLVAEVDGQVAGWVTWIINRDRNQGQIGYNGVAPEFRGHGLGTTLVQMALAKLREAGMPLAVVITGLDEGHAAARRVYERCGFEPFHQSVTYVMELKR
ncbi:GNAT family N-acetyltransferase [bacterium]|nr:GNAT family N-acetyltransferase [bacterium]